MYCKYCGKELDSDAVICPGCGKLTDVGSQVVKPAQAAPAVQDNRQKVKKDKIPQGTIAAFVTFIIYIAGKILSTIFSASINYKLLVGTIQMSEIVLVIINGIASIISLGLGIVSVVLIFYDKVSKIRRVFPICMMIVSVAYFIEFICQAVVTSALIR